MYSVFAQVFDGSCNAFTNNPTQNLRYLKECQATCNKRLHENGYLFLEEVYAIVGLHKMFDIEGIGWWLDVDDENDNYVDFGIYDRTKKTSRDFVNGLQPDVILDFNVDGNLADYLMDLAIHLGGPDMRNEFFENPRSYRELLTEMGYGSLFDEGGF